MSTEYIRYPSNTGGGGGGPITIGQPVVGGLPFNILTVDFAGNLFQVNNLSPYLTGPVREVLYYNNSTGVITSDIRFTRDSTTNDTLIKKIGTTLTSQIDVGDTTGVGFEHVLLNISDPISTSGTVAGVIDAAIFGLPDTMAVITTDDPSFINGSTNIFHHSFCSLDLFNTNTNELAHLHLGVSGAILNGFSLRYDNPGGFDVSYVANINGIGWQNGATGFNWYLPLTGPGAGQVLGSTAGLPTGGQLQWITPASGVTSLNTLTGAVVLAAGTNITLTPSGNTITIDASGSGITGPATEVPYMNALGTTLVFDANFARIAATGQSKFVSVGGVEAGYSTGMVFGSTYTLPNKLLLAHYDTVNQIGSAANFFKDKVQLAVQAPTTRAGQFLADFTGAPTLSAQISDSVANYASGFITTANLSEMQYTYNLSGGKSNRAVVGPTFFYVQSDLPVTPGKALDLNFTTGVFTLGDSDNVIGGTMVRVSDAIGTQTVAYGDLTNSFTGWACGLSVPTSFWIAGDVGSVGNGQNIATDDVNQFSVMGDSQGVSGGTAVAVQDIPGTFVAFSGIGGAAASLAYSSRTDVDRLSFGYGGLVNITTGLKNTALGSGSGTQVTDGNNNTYVGFGSGGGASATGLNDNTGVGTFTLYQMTNGQSGNTAIGYDAGPGNGLNGTLALGRSARPQASGQMVMGSSPYPLTLYTFYKGDTSSTADADNILFTKTNASGTDKSTSMWNFDTGNSTGTKDAGPFVFYVAHRETGGSGSGSYANLAASSEIIRFNPDEVYLNRRFCATPASLTAANDLVAGASNVSNVSGNTTINGLDASWINAMPIILIFSGTLTLKHDTAPGVAFREMLLAGSVDASVVPGCVFTFIYDSVVNKYRETARTFP